MEFQASLLALAFRGQNFLPAKSENSTLKCSFTVFGNWNSLVNNTMAVIGSTQVKYSMYLTDAN